MRNSAEQLAYVRAQVPFWSVARGRRRRSARRRLCVVETVASPGCRDRGARVAREEEEEAGLEERESRRDAGESATSEAISPELRQVGEERLWREWDMVKPSLCGVRSRSGARSLCFAHL